jgi:hypothetical protein
MVKEKVVPWASERLKAQDRTLREVEKKLEQDYKGVDVQIGQDPNSNLTRI